MRQQVYQANRGKKVRLIRNLFVWSNQSASEYNFYCKLSIVFEVFECSTVAEMRAVFQYYLQRNSVISIIRTNLVLVGTIIQKYIMHLKKNTY